MALRLPHQTTYNHKSLTNAHKEKEIPLTSEGQPVSSRFISMAGAAGEIPSK